MCGYENKMEKNGYGKIICNDHEIQEAESFKYLGSK
jgi:hypothetical protein